MFEPSVYAHRVYFEWIPRPLRDAEAQLCRWVRDWPPMGRDATRISRDGFIDECRAAISTVLLGTGWRHHDSQSIDITRAVERLAGRSPSVADLIDANRIVTGSQASLRSAPAWIDAAHPADAWYVAPPAARVRALMTELVGFVASSKLPGELVSAVALVRLLQIHPFRDGNGRVARSLFLAQWLHRIGPEGRAIDFLASLYRASADLLHHASLAIRDHDDWRPFAELCRDATGSTSTEAS